MHFSSSRPRPRALTHRRLGAVLAAAMLAVALPASALADSLAITFEPPDYATGAINGQDGWSSLGAAGSGCAVYDHAVASNTYGYTAFGAQSLRISNAVTSGCFGDQTFSKSLVDEAGESTAENGGLSGGTRYAHFEAQWDFASTEPGAEQPDLSVVASPDRGDGARMSWVQMKDAASGLEINFYDYAVGNTVDTGPCGCAPFRYTNVVSGLDRSVPHTIKITMDFLDGPANDIVRVYVDGALRHTGTSWEDYFRNEEGNPTRTVDSLLFRTGGTPAPGTAGKGFVIDNLTLFSGFAVPSLAPCVGVEDPLRTYRLTANCTTDHTLLITDGWTLDGDGYTITAVDPVGGHFLGAVVKNGGASANVMNLTVTASGLVDVCDAGPDRLRGILFDGASGSITNNTVTNVNQGPSGCQEGNAIEARNTPFDTTGTDLAVTIDRNVVNGYIKNGITANGSVAAVITNNVVTGSGPVGVPLAAQNGIQVAFGATAIVRGNAVSGNDYTPKSYVACGLLLYQADGVRASANAYFGNEQNVCNVGKGGGQFNPNP